MWLASRAAPRPVVRIWDDRYLYKKMFVLQGFHDLSREGRVTFKLEPYGYFERRGAPPPVGPPYQSHKNIVVLEIVLGARTVKVVYDANDIYYKIPNALLRWCDLYFKSHYQDPYLRTGVLLGGDYWGQLPAFPDLLPEPLDTTQHGKFRPASFAMEMPGGFWRSRRYLRTMEGRWQGVPLARKSADLFFLGRYWQDTAGQTLALLDAVARTQARFLGGLVAAKEQPPAAYAHWLRGPVSLTEWCHLASQARVAMITRGLQGCIGFKPLHLLMIGAPFMANRLMSNFYAPLVEYVHYVPVADDSSDLAAQLERCTDDVLEAMGRANLEHWRRQISPVATARYVLNEAERCA